VFDDTENPCAFPEGLQLCIFDRTPPLSLLSILQDLNRFPNSTEYYKVKSSMSAPPGSPQLSEEYLAEDKGTGILVLVIVFPVLAFLIVGLRLHTRFSIVKLPSHEDYAIALAMVSYNPEFPALCLCE
jgi:hypothetical protein